MKKTKIGNFTIIPFLVPHNETECDGFIIEHPSIGKLLFITDAEMCPYDMSQMGINVSSANVATTNAVTGLSGSFNAFTQDTTAYDLALQANTDAQNREMANWQGPVSDTLVDKLATQWTTLTTAGEATMIENAMLDSTGGTIV